MFLVETIRSRKTWIICLVVLQCLLLFSHLFTRSINNDELESLQVAWKILHGKVIYIDFFENHHPFYYYLLVPVIYLFGENLSTIFWARVFNFGFCLGILLFVWKLSRLIVPKKEGLVPWYSLAVLLSSVFFVFTAIELRPDVVQIFLALSAIYTFYSYLAKPKSVKLVYSALLFSFSLLFLQKTLIILLPFAGIFLYRSIIKKEISQRLALVYAITFLLPIVLYYLILYLSDSWSVYWYHNLVFNLTVAVERSSGSFFSKLLVLNFIPLVLSMLGLWYIERNKNLTRKTEIVELLVLALPTLLFSVFNKAKLYQYTFFIWPILSVISVYGLYLVLNNKKIRTILFFGVSSISILSLVLIPVLQPNKRTLALINYSLSVTGPNEYNLDGWPHFNLFRSDTDYLWLGLYYTVPTLEKSGYHYDPYEQIEKYKPRLIHGNNLDFNHPAIQGKYQESPVSKKIYVRID